MGMNTKSFHSQKKHPKYSVRRRWFDLFFISFACAATTRHINVTASRPCSKRRKREKYSYLTRRRIFRWMHSHACASVDHSAVDTVSMVTPHTQCRNPLENIRCSYFYCIFSSLRHSLLHRCNSKCYCWTLFTHCDQRTHTVELVRFVLKGCDSICTCFGRVL